MPKLEKGTGKPSEVWSEMETAWTTCSDHGSAVKSTFQMRSFSGDPFEPLGSVRSLA